MRPIASLIFVVILFISGCVTTLEISTRGEPQEIAPILIIEADTNYYRDEELEVPQEIRDEDYRITFVDVWADILIRYLNYPVDVKLYIGLEPGEENLEDTTRNTLLAQRYISQAGERHRIKTTNPDLILTALKQEKFYVKMVAISENQNNAYVKVENIYLDIRMERETSGLLPFLYFF